MFTMAHSIRTCLMAGVLAALLTPVATALVLKRDKLEVGSDAPALTVEEWISTPFGQPTLEKGKVHVVEFWATWCVPCQHSIPHLARLQKEWGADRLQIIGISEEEPKVVKPWVVKQGKRINYAIATDKNKATREWMKAADLKGVPWVFIVGPEGRIQFIGNPNSTDFDRRLNDVMRGRFDIKKMQEAAPLFERLRTERERKNWRQYDATLALILAIDQRLFREAEIDQIECMIVEQKNPQAAYVKAAAFIEMNLQDDPEAVMWLSERIATDPDIPAEHRNYPMAVQAGTAVLDQFENATVRADMLARLSNIQMAAGNSDQAIALARRAYRTAPKELKEDFRKRWVEMKSQADG